MPKGIQVGARNRKSKSKLRLSKNLSAGETVLIQTASSGVRNPKRESSIRTQILFDSGSQRTYISKVRFIG